MMTRNLATIYLQPLDISSSVLMMTHCPFTAHTVEKFADKMQLPEDAYTVFLGLYDIQITHIQEQRFQTATDCHNCVELFKPDVKSVRDHNHLIPENNYRGAAHDEYNINYKDTQSP